jgi:hypothetical protein
MHRLPTEPLALARCSAPPDTLVGQSRRRGGVATQRPAKPSTPVRFRSSPLDKSLAKKPIIAHAQYAVHGQRPLGSPKAPTLRSGRTLAARPLRHVDRPSLHQQRLLRPRGDWLRLESHRFIARLGEAGIELYAAARLRIDRAARAGATVASGQARACWRRRASCGRASHPGRAACL